MFLLLLVAGHVSHLRALPPQPDLGRHLLRADRFVGQPGRPEEDAGPAIAALVVGPHPPRLLHESRRNSERAQLGKYCFALIIISS